MPRDRAAQSRECGLEGQSDLQPTQPCGPHVEPHHRDAPRLWSPVSPSLQWGEATRAVTGTEATACWGASAGHRATLLLLGFLTHYDGDRDSAQWAGPKPQDELVTCGF